MKVHGSCEKTRCKDRPKRWVQMDSETEREREVAVRVNVLAASSSSSSFFSASGGSHKQLPFLPILYSFCE